MRQPVREKLDFISLRQATKLAKKTDCPMFLGIIRAAVDQNVPPKKIKTKSKARVGEVHGVTEGEKRRIAKEAGPVTKDVPVTQVINEKIQQADLVVRVRLEGILEEFRDVFPDKLPYGPPPKRHIDHEIDLVPGEAPSHKHP